MQVPGKGEGATRAWPLLLADGQVQAQPIVQLMEKVPGMALIAKWLNQSLGPG